LKYVAFVIVSILLSSTLLFAEEMPLTLDEALVIGLRENRNILLGEEEIKKAKAKIQESYADLFPSLNFTGSWTYTRGYYSKDMSQTNSQATLRQYLYTGGKIFNTIKYNGYIFEVSKALMDKNRIETVLDITKGLYTLLLVQEYSNLNKILLENAKEHLAFIEEKYKFGQASQSEVLKAQASLSSLVQVYEGSLNQVGLARAVLNNLLYLDKEVNIIATGDFSYDNRDVAFDQGLLKALEERPEIKQYKAQASADKSSIEIAKAATRPVIYASWDYYSRSHAVTTTVNTQNWNDYNILGVTFSWPVFDGWRAKYRVEQAIVDLKKTQLLREKAIKDITLELKEAYLALQDALSKIKSSESDLEMYEDNFKVIKEKYIKGEASFLDKSDANAKYSVSRYNQTQAIYDYMVAKAAFDKATGGF